MYRIVERFPEFDGVLKVNIAMVGFESAVTFEDVGCALVEALWFTWTIVVTCFKGLYE